jgi:hypothetical protein
MFLIRKKFLFIFSVLSIECRPDGLVVYCGLANGSIVEVDLGSKSIR